MFNDILDNCRIPLLTAMYVCKNVLYDIELFNYSHKYMSDLFVAWRKVIRRILRVPYQIHNDIVIKLGGDIRLKAYLICY